MTEDVRRWIEAEKLIEAGDTVLVGVSGGADSVCLLLMLLAYQKQIDFSLRVVHVEHGIRGAESRADAEFVEELCKRLQVRCQTYAVDVPAYAKEYHLGFEEAARELRYRSFRQAAETVLAEKLGVGKYPAGQTQDERVEQKMHIKIALAHHADDNAETMLFQMARGSGVRGMSGIRAKRELAEQVTLIRPLLGITRGQIEEYLAERGETYRVDSTNEDTDYSRNRIRHEILPQLTQVNSQAVMHMAQSAKQLAELTDYLDAETARITSAVCEWSGQTCTVKKELFEQYPVVLQKEVLHRVLGRVAGSRKDIGSAHVEALKELAKLQVGRQISLPYGMLAERIYEGIRISHKSNPAEKASETYEIALSVLEEQPEGTWYTLALRDGCLRMRVREFSEEIKEIPKKKYTKLLNYDKIKCSLQFRKRAVGDYLTIDEAGHKKKLKEYFVEEKVPRESRDAMWLLAEGSHVLWVVGKRISAYYKIDSNTKKILEIQMSGGNYCED